MNTEENFKASGLDYNNVIRVHTSSANKRTHIAPSDVELSTADLLDKFMRIQMLCQLKWEREAEQREKDAAEQAKLLTEVIHQNKDMQQREQERVEKYEQEKEQTNGYVYADGVLVHVKVADPGREWTREVVPTPRRREVLDVDHRGLSGGHFSHNRMVGSLRQYFTWPGVRRDARSYCSSCLGCQKAGRPLQHKVPMVETPIISVPYQRLACDLIGLLPRTSAGHR